MTDKMITRTFWGNYSQDGANGNKGFFSSASASTRREETQPVVLTGIYAKTALGPMDSRLRYPCYLSGQQFRSWPRAVQLVDFQRKGPAHARILRE